MPGLVAILAGSALAAAVADLTVTVLTKVRADSIHHDLEPATQTAAERVIDEVLELNLDPETYIKERRPELWEQIQEELPGEMRGGHDPEELAEKSAQVRREGKAEEMAAEVDAKLQAAELGIPPEMLDKVLGWALDEDELEYLEDNPQVKSWLIEKAKPRMEAAAQKLKDQAGGQNGAAETERTTRVGGLQ